MRDAIWQTDTRPINRNEIIFRIKISHGSWFVRRRYDVPMEYAWFDAIAASTQLSVIQVSTN